MKDFIKRTGSTIAAVTGGIMLFLLLTKIGDRGKGPLSDMTTFFGSKIAGFEKRVTDKRESRSVSLEWFNRYRYNPRLMATSDTVFLGSYDDKTAESYESIVELENAIDAKFPIISLYTAWGSKTIQVFPLIRAQAIYDIGSLPLITWEPWLDDFDPAVFPIDAKAENKNMGGMKKIAAGGFDVYIDKWAADAKSFGKPFILRLGHEMNDPYRYPWGPQNNKPEEYVAAWKHIVERFKKAGAYNVYFLWSPHPAYRFQEYYPGDDYVDWTGTTVLNYGNVATWSQWWSFAEIFDRAYKEFVSYKKPVMITEFGCLATGGSRQQWFSQALDSITYRYPAVKSVVFYHNHSDFTTSYKILDWSFRTDDSVTTAIRRSVLTWKK